HTPLADPQPLPAPFLVTATITDNYRIASAIFYWTRNGGSTTSNAMTPGAAGSYTATLPAPGTNSNTFTYWIVASDDQGSTTNGPNTFTVRYPTAQVSPPRFDTLILPETTTNLALVVTNSGWGPLTASLSILWGGFSNDVESGVAGWSHSGNNDLWTITTNRHLSGSNAWYCGNPASRIYGSSMHAKLNSTPFYVAEGAQLSFDHWIRCELNDQFWRAGWLPNSCWDGGIVEISTNLGASFQALTPIGGYPNLITGYWDAPWTDKTPCFAGTGAWSRATFDLSGFSDNVAIIRFHFGSDGNTEQEGWYLDNIVVTPAIAPQPWLSLPDTNLSVAAQTITAIQAITLNSTGILTGDRRAALWLSGNDPETPLHAIPLHLLVRSPPALAWLSAAQTSTNGTGVITFSNRVNDAEGDPCQIEYEWSTGPGSDWSKPWLISVQSAWGTALLNNATSPPLTNLITRDATGLLTNCVLVTWDSLQSGSGIVFSASTLLRARTWDGLLRGNWVTSQPFMVDNESPPAPTGLTSPTHWTERWSTNPSMRFEWNSVTEPRGTGLENYLVACDTNPSPATPAIPTTSTILTTTPPSDGSNIWASVRARDACGNISTPALAGPYWLDITPPSATDATITLALSAFGNYVIDATSISGTWRGFTDSGTGIKGYYISLQDGGGTTNGIWKTTASGVLGTLAINQTNTFHVWARDMIGWIGPAAKVSFLALEGTGDWDHDGVSNAQEEIAGTDAALASSTFKMGIASDTPGMTNGFILRWPGLSNRHYTIYYSPSLTTGNNWNALSGSSNMPGVSGLMSVTDRTTFLPAKFYKITVKSP
ncbi:MAG: hypothetical protein WCO77_09925, partial [bacterium]